LIENLTQITGIRLRSIAAGAKHLLRSSIPKAQEGQRLRLKENLDIIVELEGKKVFQKALNGKCQFIQQIVAVFGFYTETT